MKTVGKWLDRLTILARFSVCIIVLLGLLIAAAAVGIAGLDQLFTTATNAFAGDVQLAQHAGKIEILVLNERRYEKDTFINLSDSRAFMEYQAKWRDAGRLGWQVRAGRSACGEYPCPDGSHGEARRRYQEIRR